MLDLLSLSEITTVMLVSLTTLTLTTTFVVLYIPLAGVTLMLDVAFITSKVLLSCEAL